MVTQYHLTTLTDVHDEVPELLVIVAYLEAIVQASVMIVARVGCYGNHNQTLY